MNNNPKINLKLTVTDYFFEILGWLVLLSMWIIVIKNYPNLPNSIPIHFDIKGNANQYGEKHHIIFLALLSTFLFTCLTVLNRVPHLFNYTIPISSNNAEVQYSNATRMIRYIKIVIVFIFGLIAFKIIQAEAFSNTGLWIWFFPLTTSLIFLPLVCFLIKSYKNK